MRAARTAPGSPDSPDSPDSPGSADTPAEAGDAAMGVGDVPEQGGLDVGAVGVATDRTSGERLVPVEDVAMGERPREL